MIFSVRGVPLPGAAPRSFLRAINDSHVRNRRTGRWPSTKSSSFPLTKPRRAKSVPPTSDKDAGAFLTAGPFTSANRSSLNLPGLLTEVPGYWFLYRQPESIRQNRDSPRLANRGLGLIAQRPGFPVGRAAGGRCHRGPAPQPGCLAGLVTAIVPAVGPAPSTQRLSGGGASRGGIQRRVVGAIFKVPLEGECHAYAWTLPEVDFAFFDLRAETEIPIEEVARYPIAFRIGSIDRLGPNGDGRGSAR